MKKYFIVLLLIIAQLVVFYLKAHSQGARYFARISTSQLDSGETAKYIIADETVLSYTAKSAKIVCDNEKVFMKLFTTHYQLITHFSAIWKVDSIGNAYKRYTILINKEDAEIIRSWSKTNL